MWRGFAIVLVLLAPAALPAAAQWVDHAEVEPNTPWDLPDRMWRDAPPAGESRVYFNAVPSLADSRASPNVALLGTRILLALNEWDATLGMWSDCNGDGVIGMADSAVAEYSGALLDADDAARCPQGSPHHEDGWVRELLPIGPTAAPDAETDPHVVRADGVRIWGDVERHPWRTWACAMGFYNHPGTTSRTGVVIGTLDCKTNGMLINTINALDEDGSLGLRFEKGHPPYKSSSALNHDLAVHPYENPFTGDVGFLQDDSGAPAFSAWDCEADAPATNGSVETEGSFWDGAEHAWDGAVEDCDASTRSLMDELHPDLEPAVHVDFAPRARVDMQFDFRERAPPAGGLLPPEGGIGLARGITMGSTWSSNSYYVTDNALVDRTSMALREPQRFWFYASLGDDATPFAAALPGGGASFAYGAEFCPWGPEFWECDPDRWYEYPFVAEKPDAPRVGDAYHLRDVECYDWTHGLLARHGVDPAPHRCPEA